METKRYDALCSVASKLSFVMFCLYFIDILWMGTGINSRIGLVSARIVFFALSIVLSIPLLLRECKRLLRNRYVLAVCGFILWMLICAVVGYVRGNRQDIIRTDVMGYLNLLLLPTAICLLKKPGRFRLLSNIIIGSCAVMAVCALVLSFQHFFPDPLEVYMRADKSGRWSLSVLNGTTVRVFGHTATRYFFVAFALCVVQFYCNRKNKAKKIVYFLVAGLMVTGIFISYTRAIYFAVFIAALWILAGILFLRVHWGKQLIATMLCSVVLCGALVGVLGIAQNSNLFEAAVYRLILSIAPPSDSMVPDSTDSTDFTDSTNSTDSTEYTDPETTDPNLLAEIENLNIRAAILQKAYAQIQQSPIVGNGLGVAIDLRDGYIEYSYHDIVNKMGVVGLVLFILPCVFLFTDLKKTYQKALQTGQTRDLLTHICLSATMLYFLICAYFNPCLNTTVGLSAYVLSIATIAGIQENDVYLLEESIEKGVG